jgi:hypothetical protein
LELLRDFTHPFATNGSIRLPQVQRKALYFDPAKILLGRIWKHPFAKSTKWKQQLAESTVSLAVVLDKPVIGRFNNSVSAACGEDVVTFDRFA